MMEMPMIRTAASTLFLAGLLTAGCQEQQPQRPPPSTTFGPGNSLQGFSPDTGMQGFQAGGISGPGNSLMSGFRPAMPDQLNNGFRGY
jgi:hypothetical protein